MTALSLQDRKKFIAHEEKQEWEKLMSHNKMNKCAVAVKLGLMVGTVALTTPVFAQQAQADGAKKDQQVEVIQVRGIRASQEANLNAKRFSDTIVDVVTAEDIGKFPDKNVAESLSRITGVGVSREFGEGEKITIRGASSATNRTLLNGQTVATADWFILDNPGRSFNYTMLPSALVRDLEVYKSPEARIDEGSIGGTVILKTRRPLDMDANSLTLSLEGQYSDMSEKTDPQLGAMYSWKTDDERFGVLVSAMKQDRNLVREGFEVLSWPVDANGMSYPGVMGVPRFVQKRERETAFVAFQARPTEALEMTLNVLKSKVDADNHNANYLVWTGNDVVANKVTDKAVVDNALVGGKVAAGQIGYNFINRVASTETQSVDLDVNYDAGNFKVHGQVGRTDAEGGTLRETSWEYINTASGYSFDLRGDKPTVNTAVNGSDGSKFTPGWIWGGEKPTTDEETYGQLDFDIPVNAGVFNAVKTGVKIRQAERTQDRIAYSWHGPNTLKDASKAPSWPVYLQYIFDQCSDLTKCGLTNGPVTVDGLVNGTLANQVLHDRYKMEEIAFVGLNGVPADYARSRILDENWGVTEDITALYVQGDFSGEGFRGNIGVRYVDTAQTSGGWEHTGTDYWGLHTIDRVWLKPAVMNWKEIDNDYSEMLPSINVAFDLAEDKILRVGAARVMARQNWNDISSSSSFGSLNVSNPTGVANNPMLKPQLVDQFDLSYEWYFNPSSVFAATYFFKDVKSYRGFSTFVDERYWEQGNTNVDVTFTKPDNGPGGTTSGMELSYQQTFGQFGLMANYTYTDAERDETRDIRKPGSGLVEGTSKHMYNVSGYYEDDTYSARLMYNFRTDWYKGLHWSGSEIWNDDYGQLDASFGYNLSDTITLTAEAVNLTDEEVVEFNTDKNRLFSLYQNGRRYVLGVRMSF